MVLIVSEDRIYSVRANGGYGGAGGKAPGYMSFRIFYSGEKLSLSRVRLPDDQAGYLQCYVDQLNRYRIIGFHERSPVFSLYQPSPATPVGRRALKKRLERRFHGERIPATATIAVNKACQCECNHCSAAFYNHSVKREMSSPELKEAVRQSVDLGITTVIFLGGEPLLRRDLEDQIAAVSKDKATVILFTNGEYLTPSKCKTLKEAGLYGVFVSLDETDAKTHDVFRARYGLFDKAVEGIGNLKKAGVLVGISSYLSPERLKQNIFERMMEWGKNLGVNEATFFDAIPSGRWLKEEGHLLSAGDRQKIAGLVKSYRSRTAYPGLSVQSTMTSVCGSSFCFAANTQFYLTAAGEMCPCDFTPLTIGRFPEHSIRELWEKMIRTAPYNQRAKSCRMQDPEFRSRYIRPIPPAGPFPYPLQSFSVGKAG